MIVFPLNWDIIGQPITEKMLERVIQKLIREIGCNCLAFSGGLDSSLMLYYMSLEFKNVEAFTIGESFEYPDVQYANLMARSLPNIKHHVYIPTVSEIKQYTNDGDFRGDNAVRLLYKFIAKFTDSVIACDGVDEFSCGYYQHQESPNEETYYRFIRKLQETQLLPLHNNSGDLKVYLPYLDASVILLLSQIPLYEKVDRDNRKKILVNFSKGKLPEAILYRRKIGLCSALEKIRCDNVD